MHLTPKEMDRLTIFTVAEMARRRRARGLRLNAPEAEGFLCDEMMEAARDGRSYDEVVALGMRLLTTADVLDGVPALLDVVHVEPLFDDGTKLIVLHRPIQSPPAGTPGAQLAMGAEPGAVRVEGGDVPINAGRSVRMLFVLNTSPYAVQVTSHMHFAEVNPALSFDRAAAWGCRLDIPAGAAVRWEPGEEHLVSLIPRSPEV